MSVSNTFPVCARMRHSPTRRVLLAFARVCAHVDVERVSTTLEHNLNVAKCSTAERLALREFLFSSFTLRQYRAFYAPCILRSLVIVYLSRIGMHFSRRNFELISLSCILRIFWVSLEIWPSCRFDRRS